MLQDHFHALDQFLVDYRHLWQLDPFHLSAYPQDWDPALCRWLESHSENELSDGQRQLQAPGLPTAERLRSLCTVPQRHQPLAAPDRFFSQHIPGRKWEQIRYFAGALPVLTGATLEWCAGKGHLGRLLAHNFEVPVTSVEWQSALCEEGAVLAHQKTLEQHFICADALAPEASHHLHGQHACVALHACGELHLRLLRHWQGQGLLACAPCCYHLSDSPDAQSEVGRGAGLKLRHRDLSLPLQELVTAGRAERKLRTQQLNWRLAFDEWQRQRRGVQEYLSLPSIRQRVLNGPVEAFFQWAAGHHGLVLEPDFNAGVWLTRGQTRAQRVTRMEWVAHHFRRPLELWLALDRALYLQQKGARVDLLEFCPYHLTPRNLLLVASGD